MNVLALITFVLVEVSFAGFIFLIIRSGLRNPINRAFLYFLLVFSAWAASNLASNITTAPHAMMLILNRVLFVVSIIGLYYLLLFVKRVTHQHSRTLMSVFLIVLVITAGVVSLLPFVVADVFVDVHSSVGIEFGSVALAYFAVVIYMSGLILYHLAKGVRQNSLRERGKAKVLFLSIGVAIGTILVTNVLVPVALGNFAFTGVGLFAGMFIIAGASYSTARQGMFDIKRAAVRSVTYSLVLVTLALSYLIFAFLISTFFGTLFIGPGQIVAGVIISLLLALMFQPIRLFFDRITNRIFYKNEYISDDFFAALNSVLVSTTDLGNLLLKASGLIATTLKSEQTFFFIHSQKDRHISIGTKNHAKLPVVDAQALEDYFNKNYHILQTSLIEDKLEMRKLLLSHKIEVVMPLVQGDEMIGLLCLGEHLNSAYTQRDLRVLDTVSDELIIAIQNALSIDEVRDLNAHLEQRIDAATKELRASNAQLQKLDEAKDEFISMASHQLRTPLTSIKGYISMIIDGDVGKVSKEQKHLLEEAFISSERMVRLIGDFLNVSRLQTGKFVIDKRIVDLAKIVADEVDGLETNAQARGMKFVYKRPKNIPKLNIDENKIQQVIMNFCDNAIYYSKDNSTIKVELTVVDGYVQFTVKDTGIGVPATEQAQLFNKFFRATNARQQRPDGTGVGLFLAKKVIDAHNGKIVFASKEGQGSTFGFRLPIK